MNKMKEYRINSSMSQEALAKRLGVTQRHIAFLEKGQRSPSLDLAARIAECFGKSIEDIFLCKKCTKSTILEEKLRDIDQKEGV